MSTYQPPYHFQAVYRAYPEVLYVDDEKGAFDKDDNEIVLEPVSYTHLTLPTICSV